MVKMSSIWDRTTEFLSGNMRRVLTIALLAIVLPAVISAIVQAAAGTPTAATGITPAGVFSLGMTVVSLWGTTAITALAIQPSLAGEAANVATRRLFPVIGVSLVIALLVGLLILPVFGILVASGFDFVAAAAAPTGAMPPIAPGAAMGVGLYTLVLVPVMLWLLARLIIVTPVVVAERRGVGAIAQAWRLTRGHALRIVGVILLYAIVAIVVTLAVTAVAGVLLSLVFGRGDGISVATIVAALLTAAVSAVLTVIQTVYVAKLYVALTPHRELAEDFA